MFLLQTPETVFVALWSTAGIVGEYIAGGAATAESSVMLLTSAEATGASLTPVMTIVIGFNKGAASVVDRI